MERGGLGLNALPPPKASDITVHAEFVCTPPMTVRFTQNSIGMAFRNPEEGTVLQLAEDLRTGAVSPADVEPVPVYEDANGQLWAYGNRRLGAFQMAGADMPIVRTSEFIPRYFTTETLGLSIEIRGYGWWSPITGFTPYEGD